MKMITTVMMLLMISFSLTVCLNPAGAYKTEAHKKITEKAVIRSIRIKPALEAIGLLLPGEELKNKKINVWNLNEWIQHGSEWEDGMAFWNYGKLTKRGVLYCHFYNPITGFGYTDSDGKVKGQSLIERAHDNEVLPELGLINEWSYEMAKKLYYAGLTGDVSEIRENVYEMRDGHAHFKGNIPLGENISREERENFYAWTLQALGHTLHLIQDSSVPAHTRNDLHGFILEPFESWTD